MNLSTFNTKINSGKAVYGYLWEYKDYDRIAGEVWKPITKHKELKGYDVSSKGRLRNTNRVGNPLLIPHMSNSEVLRVYV